MKYTTPFILCSLLLAGSLVAESVIESPIPSEPAALTDAEVNGYMDAIVVEDFHFHQVKFASAIEKLDEVVAPFGVQILFRGDPDNASVVSLKTRDLSMAKNLSYLCKQAGYDWWVEEGIVVVAVPGSNEVLVTEVIPLRSTTATRLMKIQSVQN